MSTGLSILHQIDGAIAKARARAGEASGLSARAGEALLDLQRKQGAALGQISRDRLEIIKHGEGGDLGYVDRQAAKLLAQHSDALERANTDIIKSEDAIEALDAKRLRIIAASPQFP